MAVHPEVRGARSAAFTPLHRTLFKRIPILDRLLDGHAEAA